MEHRNKISGQSGCNFDSRLQPLILRFGGSVATHSDKTGFPKGTPLAHDFAKQSVVRYTLCRRCRENPVAAGEGKGI